MSPKILDLADEYPAYKDLIPEVSEEDPHFASLLEEYRGVQHRIHRIESLKEREADAELERMKRHRLALKDEILFLLDQAASG